MVQRFDELEVWQEARVLAREIYEVTNSPTFSRDWDLSRQIRRAAISVMSNIAEGFERGTNKEFAHFLAVAKGSVGEMRAQLYLASDLHYTSAEQARSLIDACARLGHRLASLIYYVDRCVQKGRMLREPEMPYSLSTDDAAGLSTSNQ